MTCVKAERRELLSTFNSTKKSPNKYTTVFPTAAEQGLAMPKSG